MLQLSYAYRSCITPVTAIESNADLHVAGCELPQEQMRHFISIWTLKEAYVKAVGRGIMAAPGMTSFDMSIGHPGSHKEDTANITMNPDNDLWDFALFTVGEEHIGALCAERDPCVRLINGSTSDMSALPRQAVTAQTPIRLKMWTTLPGISDSCIADCRILAMSQR